ncbi:hypothetical protein, partial [Bacillus cereus group sp. BfR-BA-01516]|uniref:hypothetical protein n=1 Tax=Bacillus cereus group sp. BfR-BA-01516 TaxID=2920366 RepID=UPI001F578414
LQINITITSIVIEKDDPFRIVFYYCSLYLFCEGWKALSSPRIPKQKENDRESCRALLGNVYEKMEEALAAQ